jgi:CDP-paratose 2-epimerase
MEYSMNECIVVTGSGGLIGSETARFFSSKGYSIIGIDNDMRSYFFGTEASTAWNVDKLKKECKGYIHHALDIREFDAIEALFIKHAPAIKGVIHTAAQPSHDWAAKEPFTDFGINANGTLNMLEACRRHCPRVPFIFTSTNKVYGDLPNYLPLVEKEERWEVDPTHRYAEHGIDESMSLDQSKHSLFGASKVAADVMAQEYGRYFGMNTAVFRGGCLTGPNHSGTKLHGFLSYLVICAVTKTPYTILGYKGKQVRDNIHSADLIAAFWEYFKAPRPAVVYNMGGSRYANVSVLEAIRLIREIGGLLVKYEIKNEPRAGDHIWYISDVRRFQKDYPGWKYRYDIRATISEIIDAAKLRYGK